MDIMTNRLRDTVSREMKDSRMQISIASKWGSMCLLQQVFKSCGKQSSTASRVSIPERGGQKLLNTCSFLSKVQSHRLFMPYLLSPSCPSLSLTLRFSSSLTVNSLSATLPLSQPFLHSDVTEKFLFQFVLADACPRLQHQVYICLFANGLCHWITL